ncbi:unnamed protein product [Prorocentrum cordatum]|uniref:Uncharacterized protein n=1 Tax=Prorocentrum cordatum TaxID=2364126 RepID=A0ABN9QMD6_9DINO|nr:unnamed protein product [Polarella glacialis]
MRRHTAAVVALGERRQWRQALHLLGSLPQPNTIVCNAAITACGRGRQWPHALALLAQMRGHGPPPDAVTYGACASACDKAGQPAAALELLGSLRAWRVRPDPATTSALVSACSRGLRWLQALDVAAELAEAADPGAPKDGRRAAGRDRERARAREPLGGRPGPPSTGAGCWRADWPCPLRRSRRRMLRGRVVGGSLVPPGGHAAEGPAP